VIPIEVAVQAPSRAQVFHNDARAELPWGWYAPIDLGRFGACMTWRAAMDEVERQLLRKAGRPA
jgi:hypothetical protein